MSTIAILSVKLTADSKELRNELDQSKKKTGDFVSGVKDAMTVLAGAAVLQKAVQAYKAVTAAAEESAKVQAKVEAVIKSTGGAAGLTSGQIGDMADEFSRLTGIDDELIQNAEAVMLTFKEVGREVFPDATKAAIDMSTVLDQDLRSSTIMVGKALNVTAGDVSAASMAMNAMRRVGVSFTTEQVEMAKQLVRTGDVLAYQKLVLGELQSEFGGAAQRMEEASSGGDRLNVSIGNLQEALGRDAIPAQRTFNLALADTVDKLTDAFNAHSDYASAVMQSAKQLGYENETVYILNRGISEHSDEIVNNAREIQRWTQYGLAWENRLAAEAQAIQELGGALEALDYESMLGLTASLANETQRFNDEQAKVAEKQADIKNEIQGLLNQGYSPLGKNIKDLQSDYDALAQRYDENAAKHQEATNKILYDLLLQKLSVDGLTDAEYQIALAAGESFGTFDQAALNTARNMDAVTQAVVSGRLEVEDMKTALENLPGTIPIEIRVTMAGEGIQYLGEGIYEQGGYKKKRGNRAFGGPVDAMRMYEVIEKGMPEMLTIGSQSFLMMGNQSGYVAPLGGALPQMSAVGAVNGSGGGGRQDDLSMRLLDALEELNRNFRSLPDDMARSNESAFQKIVGGRR